MICYDIYTPFLEMTHFDKVLVTAYSPEQFAPVATSTNFTRAPPANFVP